METLVLALPLAAPALGYVTAWLLGGHRPWVAILVAALAGSVVMAFIGAAASALANGAATRDAALRGGGIGFAAGGVVGLLCDLARRAIARRSRTRARGGEA